MFRECLFALKGKIDEKDFTVVDFKDNTREDNECSRVSVIVS